MSLHIQENTNNKVDNQDDIVNTSEEIFPPLIVKQLFPPVLSLLSKYSHVFSKNKYDVGKIRIEPTRINLNLKRQKRFGLLQTVPPTDRPFEYLSIDTVGEFNYYNSTKKYLHLVIDHATRYVWAFPSKSETSETYANCLKQDFQIQVPTKLLSDRNGAFTSSKFKRFLRNYNVKHLLTSSHHPQTNGKCERVNQSIVTKLKCKVNSSPTKILGLNFWNKLLMSTI
ncbi:hypothetical protein AVEN_150975-1 [Araneus ventricosus]|uniref:Integrase catalytic domain-containing protein n=1 Tax=Araneus ventricosus TaxID=182803 RepID=A0A4Y2SNX2_ARAVE|nr:hypothetical protein AVEN_150975-1 [Araneus ventricosus]